MATCIGSPLADHEGGTVYVNNFGAKSGADVNAVLPAEGTKPNSGAGQAAQAVAGTKKATASRKLKARKLKARKARRRASCVRKAKRIKHKKARRAAVKRCRRK
jgi:hypothetical protein